MTTREGKLGAGTHSYDLGNGFSAVCMAQGEWMIWLDGREYSEGGFNVYHPTLRDCRTWAKARTSPQIQERRK